MIGYLIKPEYAEKRPLIAIAFGFFVAILGSLLALFIVPDQSSWVAVVFTVLFTIPLVIVIEKFEEKRDIDEDTKEIVLLREHSTAIIFLLFWFIGATLGFALLALVGGEEVHDNLFFAQSNTLSTINGKATERTFGTNMYYFRTVFFNNVRVMILCLVTSFLFGFGAIFILTWNASVIAAALYQFIHIKLENPMIGIPTIGHYALTFIHGFFRYFIHGVFEMGGFFVGGLAGSMMAFALINKDFRSPKFERVILDANALLLLAVVLLIVSGLIETFVTPFFY